jgi:hypothetical protein
MGRCFYIFFFAICSLGQLTFAELAFAQDKGKSILIDGISVLAGGVASDESDSIAVLLSDVEFQATLARLIRQGSEDPATPLTDAERNASRRSVVLVQMLARQARQFREVVPFTVRTTFKFNLISRIGGIDATDKLLARFGMTDTSFDAWIETTLLATTQIRDMRQQVEAPKPAEVNARIRLETKEPLDQISEQLKKRYRRLIIQERCQELVRKWFDGVVSGGRVRILQ